MTALLWLLGTVGLAVVVLIVCRAESQSQDTAVRWFTDRFDEEG